MSTHISFLVVFFSQFCLLKSCGHAPAEVGHSGGNRLANAGSPYLREHADNPVDWYEWGPEALEKARRENKPLIISIGYASCHWCHVMEQESFMDTGVANVMKRYFVAIKVDREQRPDIDQIYLTAAQLISGQAGWPLNAFALPDGRPFYAATYFPREQWLELLTKVRRLYKNEKASLVKQADAVTHGVQSAELITTSGDSVLAVGKSFYKKTFDEWLPGLDFKNGGLAGAPKFPMPANLEFLLQYHALTGNQKARDIALLTLDKMATGGIHDALHGGFYRYSTDSLWHIPHFEKMLYDNAQLASLYAHAFRLTKNPLYAIIVRETLAFIEQELMSPEGGFYSSINADSEGVEGKYYYWTLDEIDGVLHADTANLIVAYYGVSRAGNWEDGKNVLFTAVPSSEFAKKNKLSAEAWDGMLSRARHSLNNARGRRVRPTTDDKVLTSWNALTLTAFTDAYLATGNKAYLETALKNAAFLEEHMITTDGAVLRSYKGGSATIEGFLDDYAFLAQAFINLYQVTFELHWLEKARALTRYALKHFVDPNSGMFFYTSDGARDLIARKMEVSDNVMPSSNSVFAGVLFQLGEYFQERAFTLQSRMMLNQVSKDLAGPHALYFGNWARLAGICTYQPYEVAVIGNDAVATGLELQQQKYQPLALYCGGREENLPLLENKYVEGKTIVYVCRDRICKQPVTELDKAVLLLQ